MGEGGIHTVRALQSFFIYMIESQIIKTVLVYIKSDVGSTEEMAEVNSLKFPHLHLVCFRYLSSSDIVCNAITF
jgi:hypothetical protein